MQGLAKETKIKKPLPLRNIHLNAEDKKVESRRCQYKEKLWYYFWQNRVGNKPLIKNWSNK